MLLSDQQAGRCLLHLGDLGASNYPGKVHAWKESLFLSLLATFLKIYMSNL